MPGNLSRPAGAAPFCNEGIAIPIFYVRLNLPAVKPFASILLFYALLALAMHLSSWEIVKRRYGEQDSWVKRRLPPMRVLRAEALYWLLGLLAWSLWRP